MVLILPFVIALLVVSLWYLWRDLELFSDGPPRLRIKRNFQVELIANLPGIVERIGLPTQLTIKVTLERFAGCILVTFVNTNPYPHMRFSFRRMPRFVLRKTFISPENVEIQSRILSWIIDFAIIFDIRSKTLQPLYSMKDTLRPRQWHLLQIPEAVHKQGIVLNVEIIRVTRVLCRNEKIFCIATVENAPWIHMDLVDLEPACRFTISIQRSNLFPGLVSVDEDNPNIALETPGSRVVICSVIPNSDADRANILERDVIIEVNGITVMNAQHAATLLDNSGNVAVIIVERKIAFKWSRTHFRLLPRERSIRLSTLQETCEYPQSPTTTGVNFKAVIGTPGEIILNASSKRFQYIRTDERRASTEINTAFKVKLNPDRKYINFGLWSAVKPEPELLGYGSMHLYACLAHCFEAQGPTIMNVPLGHPDRMKSKMVPRPLQKHLGVPGFNSRLCHGNIELRMTVTQLKRSIFIRDSSEDVTRLSTHNNIIVPSICLCISKCSGFESRSLLREKGGTSKRRGSITSVTEKEASS
ncbi:uncharacterized protein LOC111250747 isoform X5 [Varroa destructor]|uniref:PDZ domain-containing protein n=1 Tax=Varroa destructor TaxID=109461 RepID=A0A7M7K5Z2_VARDE|nr:uncharacterized protein LOC111250747 isoform X5 [Varroa destructor]